MSRRSRPHYHSGLEWILGVAFEDTLTRPARLAQGFTHVRCCGSPRASSPHGLAPPALASRDGRDCVQLPPARGCYHLAPRRTFTSNPVPMPGTPIPAPLSELARAQARIAELERKIGRQQVDIDFFSTNDQLTEQISHVIVANMSEQCRSRIHVNISHNLGYSFRVFWKSSGRFWGVKAVKTPVDMGFYVLGAALKFGIMSDVGIRQETASSVGRVFVRGLSGLRELSWRIR